MTKVCGEDIQDHRQRITITVGGMITDVVVAAEIALSARFPSTRGCNSVVVICRTRLTRCRALLGCIPTIPDDAVPSLGTFTLPVLPLTVHTFIIFTP